MEVGLSDSRLLVIGAFVAALVAVGCAVAQRPGPCWAWVAIACFLLLGSLAVQP